MTGTVRRSLLSKGAREAVGGLTDHTDQTTGFFPGNVGVCTSATWMSVLLGKYLKILYREQSANKIGERRWKAVVKYLRVSRIKSAV